jgi:hypothetical protein
MADEMEGLRREVLRLRQQNLDLQRRAQGDAFREHGEVSGEQSVDVDGCLFCRLSVVGC